MQLPCIASSVRQSRLMPHPLVVHIATGERYDIIVDRSSDWGNPFKIGIDGTREDVLIKHRLWLPTQPRLIARLGELRGRRLGCHCAPKCCHADFLALLANPRLPGKTYEESCRYHRHEYFKSVFITMQRGINVESGRHPSLPSDQAAHR